MLPGFPVQGWTKEGLECKNHGDMGGGGVGEGTLVEGMPCSFLSSIEVISKLPRGLAQMDTNAAAIGDYFAS